MDSAYRSPSGPWAAAHPPLNVLITSLTLRYRMGVELYVRDLAIGLQRRGHSPVVFTPEPGPVGWELESRGIPVVTKLRQIRGRPDIIHGNQQRELLAALLYFRSAPGIFVCHSHTSWGSSPPTHPRIRRYLGVSQECIHRLNGEGAPPELTLLSLNSVDTKRFHPRRPLPERPRRALVFSNYAGEATQLPAVREACRMLDIELDVVGLVSGNPVERPEEILPAYDLVFAKAKAAMEAMAVGAAVVLCDFAGIGPMVTTANFDQLRPMNFGHETLTDPLDAHILAERVRSYDAADATAVRDLIRDKAATDKTIDLMIALYKEVIAERDRRLYVDGVPPDEASWRYRLAVARDYFPERVFLSWLALDPKMRDSLALVPVLAPVKTRVARLILGPKSRR